MYYQDEINGLVFLLALLIFFLVYRKHKKSKAESARQLLLNEYSKYELLINNFNVAYQSLKISPVQQVIRTLEVVNPKYELMLPLIKNKHRVRNWEATIKDLKLLNNSNIKKNVNIIVKRFELIDQYGEDIGNRLANYNFFIGMTVEMLVKIKGEPLTIEQIGVLDSKKILTYKNKSSEEVFTFVEGKLV